MKNKCTRDYHDAFGEDYDKCMQCLVRDSGPWDENPFLKDLPKGTKLDDSWSKIKLFNTKDKNEINH